MVANFGCTEEFALVTETFEDVLVVEATITNELKIQQIRLSRTFPLEGEPFFENKANVRVIDSNNNEYTFNDTSGGLYVSTTEFQAEQGVSYRLLITTSDGKEYSSIDEFLPESAEISNLYAELITSGGKRGIQVLVDSNDNLGNSNYFRYEYEETYQRIADYFFYYDLIISDASGIGTDQILYSIREEVRPDNERVCYESRDSNEIIVTSTDGLIEQKVSKFPVRFISDDDIIIRDRYSILVKQYVQSADANNYYRILKDISSDESLLIDKQPGFIQGNVFSSQSIDEKVVGFFDVSSVSSERIFFTYSDFGIIEKPEYPFLCKDSETLSYNVPDDRPILYDLLVNKNYKYNGRADSNDDMEYVLVRPECGNCSSYASNIRPDFWED